MAQCTAKSKRSGERCKKLAIVGRNTCRNHGGKTPRGPLSVHYKTGRYSKLPVNLRDGFEAALSDPDLMNRRQDMALIIARINELLEKLSDGGGAARDVRLKELARAYRAASTIANPDQKAQQQARAIMEIINLIERGVGDEVWNEIGQQVDRFNRLAEGDRKRLESLHASITADQAMVMMDAFVTTTMKYVTDGAIRTKIANDFDHLVTRFLGGEGEAVPNTRVSSSGLRAVAEGSKPAS